MYLFMLEYQDSNLDRLIQNQKCCRCTILHYGEHPLSLVVSLGDKAQYSFSPISFIDPVMSRNDKDVPLSPRAAHSKVLGGGAL